MASTESQSQGELCAQTELGVFTGTASHSEWRSAESGKKKKKKKKKWENAAESTSQLQLIQNEVFHKLVKKKKKKQKKTERLQRKAPANSRVPRGLPCVIWPLSWEQVSQKCGRVVTKILDGMQTNVCFFLFFGS